MEEGGCFRIWLNEPFTGNQKSILKGFEIHLMKFKGFSFMHEFRTPNFKTDFEKKQLQKKIGFIPQEEIYLCGIATPIFRSAEAILQYFGGYLQVGVGNAQKEDPSIKGICVNISKRGKFIPFLYELDYQLIDWELIANYFNHSDSKMIKEIYSIQNYITNYLN
jgi:hypothetical protein